MMKLISWNCRGIGNPRFLRHVINMCRQFRPDVLVLLETRANSAYASRLPESLGFQNHFRVPSEGFSGGIWVFWNKTSSHLSVIASDSQTVHLEVSEPNKAAWFLSCCYVRPSDEFREVFWQSMMEFSRHHSRAWLAIGDFNDYLLADEKVGGSPSMNRCTLFAQRLDDCNLFDMGASGTRFTWHGRQVSGSRLRVRLDRGLINLNWRHAFPDGRITVFPRAHGDHHALLLHSSLSASVNKPFRCEAAWLKHPQFKDVFHASWTARPDPIDRRISRFQEHVKIWNVEVFRKIFQRKKTLMNRIAGIQRVVHPPQSLLMLEEELIQQLDDTLRQEEVFWKQKKI